MMKATLFVTIVLGLTSGAFGGVIPHIVGGANATAAEFPYMGALFLNSGGNYYYLCGAVLYTSTKVLTAAHCLSSQPESYAVGFGFTDFNLPEPNQLQLSNITSYIAHPDYNNNIPGSDSDIAVVTLTTAMDLSNSAIDTISIATSDANFVGDECTVTGWGRLSNTGAYPDILQKVNLTVISNTECEAANNPVNITTTNVCAEATGKSLCTADSGSPMVCNGLLKGLVPYYIGSCDDSLPAIFTRVPSFVSWISNQ